MIVQIALSRFRNLSDGEWELEPGSHLLLGANGAGKTSFLEALYLAATTRSFRTSRLADCVRHGEKSWLVQAEVEEQARVRLEVGWDREEGRHRLVNGATPSLSEHLAACSLVSWSSADSEVVSGGPQARRRLLDQGVIGCRPAAVAVLSRYRRALLQKRLLLARRQYGLEGWNQVLADPAAEIVRLRRSYSAALARVLEETLESADLGLPPVEIRYRPSIDCGEEEGFSKVLEELERIAPAERERRQPLAGPHRDELLISMGGRDVRRVGSAGERKALGLLLTAARRRVLEGSGRRPLLLLDDLDSELDRGRLTRVWSALLGGSQTVVTSSRPEAWQEGVSKHRWRLESGRLERS